jgi:hypothetical protein
MKTDSYEQDICFKNKWNCFFSLLQFQIDWCDFEFRTMIIQKRDRTKKNDQLRHDWRAKHIDEIEWKNNNRCVY